MRVTAEQCAVCGRPVDTSHGESSPPLIVICPGCGTGLTLPKPTRDVESDRLFVEAYGDRRLKMRRQWFLEAHSRLAWIRRHIQSGTLLEVGCATGEFVAVAADAGYRTYGCDTSLWALERAVELGRGELTAGTLAAWRAGHPGQLVDAIAMFHVLEHVENPAALLEEAREVLHERGVLFLEVPNFGSVLARRDPQRWKYGLLKDHYHHFTSPSLSRLLGQVGFDNVRVEPLDWRAYDSRIRWPARRLRWLSQGILRPSQDLLRASGRSTAS